VNSPLDIAKQFWAWFWVPWPNRGQPLLRVAWMVTYLSVGGALIGCGLAITDLVKWLA
jgi:hypothetical protein